MSLGAALEIGRSGLLASQAAIMVTGNNLANASTPGYNVQTINLAPIPSQEIQQGVFIGQGVQIQSIVSQINQGLDARLNNATSDESASNATTNVLTQVQSVENELSGTDISTQLDAFFNAWSSLANSPTDDSLRTAVVQQGNTLAQTINTIQQGLQGEQTNVDQNIQQDVSTINGLLDQVQTLNQQIGTTDAGSSGAAALTDQMGQVLSQLSQYMDISTVQAANGTTDVYVGSTPIVLNGQSRGLAVTQTAGSDGTTQLNVTVQADGTILQPQSGELGALIASRTNDVQGDINTLNQFSNDLINEVNQVYSQGQGQSPVSSVTGDYQAADPNAALNTPAAELSFTPTSGSFQLYVTQQSTGQVVANTINVDLSGDGSDTTLSSLAAQINSSVANVTATVTPDNRLQITANGSDFGITFGDDTSGALAALGVNTFFSGSNAANISVNSTVASDPSLLAAGQDNVQGDNSNALAIANLSTQSLASLGGISLSQVWANHVSDYAVKLSNAQQQLAADTTVQQNLQTQQQAYSGVNTDNETINLLSYQRAYQGTARFLSVIDQMMQTLLAIQ